MFNFDFVDDGGGKSNDVWGNGGQGNSPSPFEDTFNLPQIGSSNKPSGTSTSDSLFGGIFENTTPAPPQSGASSTFPSLFDFSDTPGKPKPEPGKSMPTSLDIWGATSSASPAPGAANDNLSLFGEVSTKDYGLSLFGGGDNGIGSGLNQTKEESKTESTVFQGLFSGINSTPTKEHTSGAVNMQRLWRGHSGRKESLNALFEQHEEEENQRRQEEQRRLEEGFGLLEAHRSKQEEHHNSILERNRQFSESIKNIEPEDPDFYDEPEGYTEEGGELLAKKFKRCLAAKSKEKTFSVRKEFKKLDIDHSGTISRKEFRTAIDHFDLDFREVEVNILLHFLDKSDDGEIDLAEFKIFREMDTDDIPEPSVQSKVALESKFEKNQKAVLDIQRVVRGHQGRAVYAEHLAEHINNHAGFEEERIRKWEEEERERKASEEKEKQIQAEKREAKLRLEKAQMMESKARAEEMQATKRHEEEAAAKRQEEEAARQRQDEDDRRRQEQVEADRRRREEEEKIARQREKVEEEAKRRRRQDEEEAARRRRAEEEETKRRRLADEEAAQRKRNEIAAEKRKEEEKRMQELQAKERELAEREKRELERERKLREEEQRIKLKKMEEVELARINKMKEDAQAAQKAKEDELRKQELATKELEFKLKQREAELLKQEQKLQVDRENDIRNRELEAKKRREQEIAESEQKRREMEIAENEKKLAMQKEPVFELSEDEDDDPMILQNQAGADQHARDQLAFITLSNRAQNMRQRPVAVSMENDGSDPEIPVLPSRPGEMRMHPPAPRGRKAKRAARPTKKYRQLKSLNIAEVGVLLRHYELTLFAEEFRKKKVDGRELAEFRYEEDVAIFNVGRRTQQMKLLHLIRDLANRKIDDKLFIGLKRHNARMERLANRMSPSRRSGHSPRMLRHDPPPHPYFKQKRKRNVVHVRAKSTDNGKFGLNVSNGVLFEMRRDQYHASF